MVTDDLAEEENWVKRSASGSADDLNGAYAFFYGRYRNKVDPFVKTLGTLNFRGSPPI